MAPAEMPVSRQKEGVILPWTTPGWPWNSVGIQETSGATSLKGFLTKSPGG